MLDAEEECIGWRAIVVGRESPALFEGALANLSQGWSPTANVEEYPVDVVLGLEREARLTRLEITAIGWMAPHRVDIKLAEGRSFLPLDYKNARKAKYFEAGKIKFDPLHLEEDEMLRKFRRGRIEFGIARGNSMRSCRFIWLVLHSAQNAGGGKIAITDLKIFGFKEEPNSHGRRRRRFRQLFTEMPSSSDDDDEKEEEVGEEREREGGDGRREDKHMMMTMEGRRRRRKDGMEGEMGRAGENFEQIEEELKREWKKAIGGKGNKQQQQQPFRAMVLERALDDLRLCQSKMLELRSKRTIAIANGHIEEAEHLRGTMHHCVDNFYRANQLDLLIHPLRRK